MGYWGARRVPETGSLRILVDGRVMQDRYRGMGRCTSELLRELSRAGRWISSSCTTRTAAGSARVS